MLYEDFGWLPVYRFLHSSFENWRVIFIFLIYFDFYQLSYDLICRCCNSSSFHEIIANNDYYVRSCRRGWSHFTWFLNGGITGNRLGDVSNFIKVYWKMLIVVEEVCRGRRGRRDGGRRDGGRNSLMRFYEMTMVVEEAIISLDASLMIIVVPNDYD